MRQKHSVYKWGTFIYAPTFFLTQNAVRIVLYYAPTMPHKKMWRFWSIRNDQKYSNVLCANETGHHKYIMAERCQKCKWINKINGKRSAKLWHFLFFLACNFKTIVKWMKCQHVLHHCLTLFKCLAFAAHLFTHFSLFDLLEPLDSHLPLGLPFAPPGSHSSQASE